MALGVLPVQTMFLFFLVGKEERGRGYSEREGGSDGGRVLGELGDDVFGAKRGCLSGM